MKRPRLQQVTVQLVAVQLVTAAVLALSCEPELSREEALAGKHCAGEADCVEGYLCGVDGICVPSSSVTAAAGSASGGTSAVAGNGNDPRTSGSSDGGSSAGGASGSGAGSGTASGGSAGSQGAAGSSLGGGEPDAGGAPPDPPDASPAADGGCTPIRVFRDLDGDGFGSLRAEDQALACSVPEGFVTVGGDCFDGPTILSERAQDVHPGQTDFFFVGYHFDPNDISVVSFDYDCSGAEERDETNSPNRAAADCSQLPVPCAAPLGFERTERSGSGVDNLCGSEFTATCIGAGATCVVSTRTNVSEPFRCH